MSDNDEAESASVSKDDHEDEDVSNEEGEEGEEGEEDDMEPDAADDEWEWDLQPAEEAEGEYYSATIVYHTDYFKHSEPSFDTIGTFQDQNHALRTAMLMEAAQNYKENDDMSYFPEQYRKRFYGYLKAFVDLEAMDPSTPISGDFIANWEECREKALGRPEYTAHASGYRYSVEKIKVYKTLPGLSKGTLKSLSLVKDALAKADQMPNEPLPKRQQE